MAVPMAAPYHTGEVPLASPGALPSSAAHSAPAAELVESPEPTAAPRSRVFAWLTLMTLLLACGMFLLAAVAVGYVVVTRASGASGGNPFRASASNWSAGSGSSSSTEWHLAQDRAITVGPASVRIVRVEIGEARGKDAAGNVIISDGDYLQVLLRIENRTPAPLEYRSWYGNEFPESPTTNKNALRVRLHDDAGRDYSWVIFDDVKRVRWHTPQASIPPRKSVDDVIVFQLPPGATKANLKSLRIELPAAAVGFRSGYYRFEIPRSMIEGLDS
jgi:hypothetical protein